MITPEELKARFPYQFAGPHIELSLFKGCVPLFAQLCADIDAELGPDESGFRWVQLKKKFGAARWYSQLGEDAQADEQLRNRLRRMRMVAQDQAEAICIVCGAPGEADRTRRLAVLSDQTACTQGKNVDKTRRVAKSVAAKWTSILGPVIPKSLSIFHADVDLLRIKHGRGDAGLQVHGFGHIGGTVFDGRGGQQVLLCHKPRHNARKDQRVERL